MAENVTVFIVEGEARDLRFITQMSECFFQGKYKQCVLFVPAKMNLYMLYNTLKQDEFETDLVELLRDKDPSCAKRLEGIERDDISDVYLFFDYDAHQNNLLGTMEPDQALEEMLEVFDNETENGKLYLSYPMVEALYDCKGTCCQTLTNCFVPVSKFGNYKTDAGQKNSLSGHTLKIEEWRAILGIFGLRISCLFDKPIDFKTYRTITPMSVLRQQEKLMDENGNRVFVLSAFPEFLYDYFPVTFWKTFNARRNFKYKNCPKMEGLSIHMSGVK